MRRKMSVRAGVRIICAFSVLVSVLATGPSAQSKPDNLTIKTSSGSFQLAPLSSLMNDSAVLGAERVAELALPAAQKDVTAAKNDVDKIDGDISTNFAAMDKEKETLAKARLEFQPTMDAYTKDLDALHAEDAQFAKDKAPVQAEIDAYLATPEKDRTDAQYKRLAALKAPLDARWEAILARKAALGLRYDAMAKVLTEQEQPLANLQKIDLDLLAQRKVKVAALGEAYRVLQACYLYSTQIKAQLQRMNRTPPPALTPILESANEVLKGMSSFGFDVVK
jgi:chromosome segregation ATPase